MGLNGSTKSWVPGIKVPDPESRLGAGVEKSMSKSSATFFVGDLVLSGFFLRSSSNEGITFGGVSGTAGFRIDFG